MNVASFLSGNFLTHLDLPQPCQTWTITSASQQQVGTDTKICLSFAEYPAKPLGLNKTNLRRVAELHGMDASAWQGKQVQVYRSTTMYSGKQMQCVRVCGAMQAPPDMVCDPEGRPVAVHQSAAAPQQPAPAQPTAAPVSAPQANPWDVAAAQQNNPPSA